VFQLLAGTFLLITAISAAGTIVIAAGAAARVKIVLAWHAGFASRWLESPGARRHRHPDNFFTALHDALIKNQGTQLYDHAALAEKFRWPRREERDLHAAQGAQVPQRGAVTPSET